jgi:hypothetical protein
MYRKIALIVCLAVTAGTVAAPGPAKERQQLLDVQPAAAPVPALKYQLLPELSEMNPGNAIPAYLRCFGEQQNFFFKKESSDERERLINCPLTDLKSELKSYGGSALRQADHAARLEYADWNLLPQLRREGYWMLLPEIQQMRTLSKALVVRCRAEVADKDFPAAVRTLKTIFAFARHMGEHPTMITSLVGAAIAQSGVNVLEELIQQPGAPNMYWALATLPTQLVDMRKAVSGDRMMAEFGLGPLSDPQRVWTADDIPVAMQKGKELASISELSEEDRKVVGPWIEERLKDEAWLTAARKYLTENGYPTDKVAKYSPEQVLYSKLLFRGNIYRDEALKWMNMPYWQAQAFLGDLDKGPADMEEKLARITGVAIPNVRAAHARLEQRLALLRVVEAIRLEAAKNGGKLPAGLTELHLPLPVDPVTGKSFAYKLDGMTAVLEGKPIPAPATTWKYSYEVRLRK